MWKKIMHYPYYVNENGSVKNMNNKILKPLNKHNGYLCYCLYNEDGAKEMLAHRLVATYFVSNPANKPVVNHKNGNKHDNRFMNLEWVSYSENTQHAWSNNLVNSNHLDKGVIQLSLNGDYIAEYKSCAEAYRQTGVKHIHDVAKGTRKTAGGYKWEFVNKNIPLHATGKKKRVAQYDLNQYYIAQYNSISEAARVTNINRKSINDCCNDKLNTAGGYKWMFI